MAKENKVMCFINPEAAFKDGGFIGEITTFGGEKGEERGIRIEIPMRSHSMDAIKATAEWLAGKSWEEKKRG